MNIIPIEELHATAAVEQAERAAAVERLTELADSRALSAADAADIRTLLADLERCDRATVEAFTIGIRIGREWDAIVQR